MRNAIGEEGVLLTYDLARDLQNGPGALLEAAHDPVGVGPGFVDEGADFLQLAFPLRLAGNAGVEGLVRDHARQGIGIEINLPAPVRRRADEDIGCHRLRRRRAENQTRLGIEAAQLGNHVGEIFLVDAAGLAQLAEFALGEKVEVIDQCRHRRVEPILFAQLQAQAFREIARADADGIEAMNQFKRNLAALEGQAKPLRHRLQRFEEIAGLVDLVDDLRGDHPGEIVGVGAAELIVEMLMQRGRRCAEGFEVGVILVERGTLARAAGKVPERRISLRQRLIGHGLVGKRILEIGAGLALERCAVSRHLLARPVAGLGGERGLDDRAVVRDDRRVIGARITLQQRIFLEFGLDIVLKFGRRELQKLDRLQELRRHDQRLALAHHQFRT